MSGSPKMTKRFPLPVLARSSAMWRSAFMRALRTGNAPSLLNSRCVSLEVERARDEHIETGLSGLAGSAHEILTC